MVFQLVNALLRCYIWFSVLRGAHQALALAPSAIRRAGAERRRAALRDALRVLVTWALWCYTERFASKVTWLLPLYDVGIFFALIFFALLRNQFALALYVQAAPWVRAYQPFMDAVLLQSANFVAGAAFLASLLLAKVVLKLKQSWAKLRGSRPTVARPNTISQPAMEPDIRMPPPVSRSRRTRTSSLDSDQGDASSSSVRGRKSLLRPPSNHNLKASASSRSLRQSTSASSLRGASSLAPKRALNGTRGATSSVSGALVNGAGSSKLSASPAEKLAALPAAPLPLPISQAELQDQPEPSESTQSKLYPDPRATSRISYAGIKHSDSPAALKPPAFTQAATAAFPTPQVPGAFGATHYGLATLRPISTLNALGMPLLGSAAMDAEGPPSARIAAHLQEASSAATAAPIVTAPLAPSLAPPKPAMQRKTSSSTSARIAPSRGLKASEPQRQVPPPTPRARAKARAQRLRAHSAIQLRDEVNGAEDDLEFELPPELSATAASESRKMNDTREGVRGLPSDLVPPPSRTTRTKFTPTATGTKNPVTNILAYRTKAQSFTSSASAMTPSVRAPSSSVPTVRAGDDDGENEDETLTHPRAAIGSGTKKRKEPPAQPMSSTPAPKRATRARATRSTSAAPLPPVPSTSTTPAAQAVVPKATAKARALAKAKRSTLSRSTSRKGALTKPDKDDGATAPGAEALLGSEVDAEMAEKALRALIEGAGGAATTRGLRGRN